MRRRRSLLRARTALVLSLVPGLLGVALSRWPPAASLEKTGLDLLFLLRGPRPAPAEVCVVAIDEDSYTTLGLDSKEPWPRGLHAQLIRTLKAEGAKAVAFDVVFVGESDPTQDTALVGALSEAGNVVLGSTVEAVDDPQFRQFRLLEPDEPIAHAAARVAEVDLPTDRDGAIRYAWPAREGEPGLALAAYEVATGDTSHREARARLIDFYGKARSIRTISIYQALEPRKYLPPGFFRGKIVFVGLSQSTATGPTPKDAFRTSFGGGHGSTTYGVEIHATLAENLLEHREITLLDPRLEVLLLFLLPVISSLAFMALRPMAGGVALLALLVAPWLTGYFAFTQSSLWVPTVIPSAIQLPMSYGLSLIWYYLTTVRDREKIKRAFGLYLSAEMIRRIAADPDAVDLGGHEIEGTAVFTDIAGFTPIAEGLSAHDTAAMLNAYFSGATRHVFDAGGTLIKFIGDAVFAIWGAPIFREDHATQACMAALALSRAQDGEIPADAGPVASLRTRIGVHTGSMLVGNLGSAQRFDYTAIGDAVNLASRIEGLNKVLGTRALLSGQTLRRTDGRFITRPLGLARVVGRKEPVELHELIALGSDTAGDRAALLEAFAAALELLRSGRFAEAARGFDACLELSGGLDGPSKFFAEVARRLAADPPQTWDGVVTFETK